MLRIDLKAAGVPYEADGLFADFPALRHSYITLLSRTGASAKVTQELARHSDVRLTMNRYTHVALYDLTAAVEKLPFFLPPYPNHRQPLAATGTDQAAHSPQHSPAGEIRRVSLTIPDTDERSEAPREPFAETLQIRPFATGCDGHCSVQLSYGRENPSKHPISLAQAAATRYRVLPYDQPPVLVFCFNSSKPKGDERRQRGEDSNASSRVSSEVGSGGGGDVNCESESSGGGPGGHGRQVAALAGLQSFGEIYRAAFGPFRPISPGRL